MSTDSKAWLSPEQCAAIVELGSRGSGGMFDQQVMSQLFVLQMIEVRNEDRRVGLTDRGREAYQILISGDVQADRPNPVSKRINLAPR